MAKLVVCKRCGEAGLMWRQSKKGGWYLTHPEPATVRGESGRVIKSFYPAHRCAEQDPQQAAHEGAERHLEHLENAYFARMTGTHPD